VIKVKNYKCWIWSWRFSVSEHIGYIISAAIIFFRDELVRFYIQTWISMHCIMCSNYEARSVNKIKARNPQFGLPKTRCIQNPMFILWLTNPVGACVLVEINWSSNESVYLLHFTTVIKCYVMIRSNLHVSVMIHLYLKQCR
jgi:hypothetical protein